MEITKSQGDITIYRTVISYTIWLRHYKSPDIYTFLRHNYALIYVIFEQKSKVKPISYVSVPFYI